MLILGMMSPIKFETICVFMMVIEEFSQQTTHKKTGKYHSFLLLEITKWYDCDHVQEI